MKTLLLTYFQAFGGEARNASAEAAKLLPERIGAWTLYKRELPVVFGRAGELCVALIHELRPSAVLMLGQAAGRRTVTPELVARNLRYARIPDNEGSVPRGEPVIPGGEDALFATLSVWGMTESICAAGLPASLSTDAGRYVCNDLYYTVLHALRGLADTDRSIPAAFLHVPSAATLPSAQTAAALTAAIQALRL